MRIPGFLYDADTDTGGSSNGTPTFPPASAVIPPVASPSGDTTDWKARYTGLSRTAEEQRQKIAALEAQVGVVPELRGMMEKMAAQLDTLAATNATLEAQRKAAEEAANQQRLETRKRDLLAAQNPNLVKLAAYIPVAEDEAAQLKAVTDFVAAVQGASAPSAPPSPPSSSPPAPVSTTAQPTMAQAQQNWLDAILSGNTAEAAKLESQFMSMFAASPDADRWSPTTIAKVGARTEFPV